MTIIPLASWAAEEVMAFDPRDTLPFAGIGTVQNVRRCYEPSPPPSGARVRVPSRAPTAIASWRKPGLGLAETKLILHVVIAEGEPGALRPVACSEAVLLHRRGVPTTIRREFAFGGKRYLYELTVRELVRCSGRRGAPPRVGAQIQGVFRLPGSPGFVAWSPEPRAPLDTLHHAGRVGRTGQDHKRFVSVARGPRRQVHVFYGLTRADVGDPLREVPLAEFLAGHEDALVESVSPGPPEPRYLGGGFFPWRGILWALHAGGSYLLLLVAAMLLAQALNWRRFVFVGLLVGALLYAAALDRWALETHLARLADPSTSARDRITACDQTTDTFFYCPAAVEELRKVADDPAAPRILRDRARRTADVIEAALTGRGYM